MRLYQEQIKILKDKLNDLPPFYQNIYQSESEKKPGW